MMTVQTKHSQYVERVLRERPTHTKGGTPVEISPDGRTVRTYTGRDFYGRGYSVYVPCDYPALFGWQRTGRQAVKPPMIIKHKGRRYLRLSVQ